MVNDAGDQAEGLRQILAFSRARTIAVVAGARGAGATSCVVNLAWALAAEGKRVLMKFSLNGALTIGTLDGANIEIRDEVGADNFFLFGLTAHEVAAAKAQGYDPMDCYRAEPVLRESLDLIASGFFSRGDTALFRPLIDNLLYSDPFLVLADFALYQECQQRVSEAYLDTLSWTRMKLRSLLFVPGDRPERMERPDRCRSEGARGKLCIPGECGEGEHVRCHRASRSGEGERRNGG